MTLTDTQVRELIDYLTGTCLSLDSACQQMFECGDDALTRSQCGDIDDAIFECETCGWWFETFEQGEDADRQVCESCAG